MKLVTININKLNPAEYNPRKDLQPGDREYEKLKKSIKEFGYVEPIICNKDFTIIGGHQRYKILKEFGIEKVDCIIVDFDKVKEKALNIALNKNQGLWDFEALDRLLEELKNEDIDITITGFDIEEIEKSFNKLVEESEVEDENEKEFQEVGEDIETNNECPRCKFRW